MKKFWLYLEPHTFIFQGDEQGDIYNSINGAYHQYFYSECPLLEYIVNEIDNSSNGYGVSLDESEMSLVQTIIEDLRETVSGDCILLKNQSILPFIFKPTCRIMEERMNFSNHKEEMVSESFWGEMLANLNEITIHLGRSGEDKHPDNYPYYRQFIHSIDLNIEEILSEFDYIGIIQYLCNLSIGKLNIVLNKNAFHQLTRILPYLYECEFKICFYLNFKDLDCSLIELLSDFMLIVYIHKEDKSDSVIDYMKRYSNIDIVWNAIVSSEEELMNMESLGNQVAITPYYNGYNEAFFKDFVYNDIDSILKYPVDRQTIFRRKTLNENFFGKLFILPNGDTFSNMNASAIGNIKTMSLSEIVFLEMKSSTAWFKLREEEACANCCNRYLCPSVSDYELVIGKLNLCHIKS